MASRKMTFTIPEALAGQLVRRIPSRERSHYVAEAIAARLKGREQRLVRACEIANADADVQDIEQTWDSLADEADRIAEPWTDAPPR